MASEFISGSTFERSRYIELDIYHAVERYHPFYIEKSEIITTTQSITKVKEENVDSSQ